MNQAFQVAPGLIYRREKPERNPDYRRFVKRHACAACSKTWNVDPCHTGPHGVSQKSSDRSCIPLCRRCHDEFGEDPQGFATLHSLDVPALIRRLNAEWDLRRAV